MRCVRIMGLCIIVAFALAVVGAASASASLPAVYECAKVAGGKYEKGCTKEGGKGGYELREGVGKGKVFKGKGGRATLHTPTLGASIGCKSFKDEGKVTGPKEGAKVVATFSDCETLAKKCTSSGQKAGTIKTFDLKSGLGYIDAAEHRVGADLSPESGKELANFSCEGLTVVVEGSVIGEVTPVNVFTKTATYTFETVGGLQKYKKLEGMPEDVLEATIGGGGPFESGQECSAANKGEDLELKA